MSKHVAVWSVGDFLPGQIVTGISPERLAELVAMGAVQVVDAPVPEPNDPTKLTVEQLKAALTDRGVEFDPKALKADLLALYGGA